MFDNIGNKIKGVAKAVFWILAVAGVISALAMFVIGIDEENAVMILMSIISIPLSILSAFITVMLLYGFGEIVQNSIETKILTQAMYDVTYESYSMNYDDRDNGNGSNFSPAIPPRNGSNLERAAQSMGRVDVNAWRCPDCDTSNDKDAQFCRGCGRRR